MSSEAQSSTSINGPMGGYVGTLVVAGRNVIASNGGGIYLSKNNGSNWTNVFSETNTHIYGLAVIDSGNVVLAGTDKGVFQSTDTGNTWGPLPISGITNATIYSFAETDSNLFAATSNGVFELDSSLKWTKQNSGLADTSVKAILVYKGNIVAGTGTGVFISANQGASWTRSNMTNATVYSLIVKDSTIFAGTGSGILSSADKGANWTATSSGLPVNTKFTSLSVSGNKLFAGTDGSGIFLSADNAVNWQAVNSGLKSTSITSLAASGSNLFASTYGNGVFLSSNDGALWTEVSSGLKNLMTVSCLMGINNFILAGSLGAGVFENPKPPSASVGWTATNVGLTAAGLSVKGFWLNGTSLFIGTNGGVFVSSDGGATWSAVNSGLPINTFVYSFAAIGTNLFAATSAGVFFSANDGVSWSSADSGLPKNSAVTSLAVNGQILFAGTGLGVYRSEDNGASWTWANLVFPVNALASIGSNLFAGTTGGGVFLSQNNGANWAAVNSNLPTNSLTIKSFLVYGNNLLANIAINNSSGGFNSGVAFSADNGTSWKSICTGYNFTSLAINWQILFVGTYGYGVLQESLAGYGIAVKQNKRESTPNGLFHADRKTVDYVLPAETHVSIKLYDLSGRCNRSLVNCTQAAGEHLVTVPTSLPPGLFIISFRTGNSNIDKRVLIP